MGGQRDKHVGRARDSAGRKPHNAHKGPGQATTPSAGSKEGSGAGKKDDKKDQSAALKRGLGTTHGTRTRCRLGESSLTTCRRPWLAHQARGKDGEKRLEKTCSKLERARLQQLEEQRKALAGQACNVYAISPLPLTNSTEDGLRGAMLIICESRGSDGVLEELGPAAAAVLGMGCCEALLVADAAALIDQRWPEESSTPGICRRVCCVMPDPNIHMALPGHAGQQGPVSKPIANVVKRVCRENATVCAIGERCGAVLARLMHDVTVCERVVNFVFAAPSLRTIRHSNFQARCKQLEESNRSVVLLLAKEVAESEEGKLIAQNFPPSRVVVLREVKMSLPSEEASADSEEPHGDSEGAAGDREGAARRESESRS
eukprot:757489-Rhodomonas_salina.1